VIDIICLTCGGARYLYTTNVGYPIPCPQCSTDSMLGHDITPPYNLLSNPDDASMQWVYTHRHKLMGLLVMAMEKYGVNHEEVKRLIELGLVDSEDEALEKVASGEAAQLIKTAEARKKGDKTEEE
jgi:hypothetical protein